eukprot:TRINITY_DN66153_c0_g1_i1.p1 TRINITY_DN66153_c0_g1~~TRINITY_DN66153_c0_g1_i1.p1  ORF type:complete len:295 (-),score=85.73 TRINITY_DN66153_c0_g1_i1:100-984(-)
MLEDPEVSASGGNYAAHDEDKARQLRERVRAQMLGRKKKDYQKREEERKLVEDYKEYVEREKAAKKKEIGDRLERLKARKKSPVGATKTAGSLTAREHYAAFHTGSSMHLETKAMDGAESDGSPADRSEKLQIAEDGSPKAASAMFDSSEAGTQSASPKSRKPGRGKRLGKGVGRSRERSDAAAAVVDERVAKLNESLGFRPMLAALERIEANDKGGAFRKLPNLQPITQKAEEDPGAEGGDGKDEEQFLKSQRHLARRQRLRLMNQVASEVLKGKQQLANSLEQEFPSRMFWS